MYWSIHVHVDLSSTNLLLNHDSMNDHVEDDALADAVIHQHHRAAGTEMCFDMDMVELDVTKALVQLVDVALEAHEQQKQQQKHQQHCKHKHAQIPSSLDIP